ncbi:DNA-(apurinic or apyrimidinic site) endonuclease 2 [Lepisosteus oculatus]|uniref:DNA-(apurinic or apyrimidinic site) endonuclease 2 n=1 Tax=Lepisosteus oculatus TaxID=7918 RepID=UPI0035F5223A
MTYFCGDGREADATAATRLLVSVRARLILMWTRSSVPQAQPTRTDMKIVSWNINGIRTFKAGIKKSLDALDADIICLQETKVTRELLDERTAIVEGYNSYFSFSKGRSGYSGVATFCKDNATPFAAEEGLTGLLTNHGGAVGCYGDQAEFSDEELQTLDSEGRAIITQHRIVCGEREETLTVLNVYCPRADPEKPERRLFKLRFYQLLQIRAEAILGAGGHVIVLGDVNTSHRPIDHCDPDDVDDFDENPGRKWLDHFLAGRNPEEGKAGEEGEGAGTDSRDAAGGTRGGRFVDTFRHFHPARSHAFTCWSTVTGARRTNYGTRIDYILASRGLAEAEFLDSDILPEVEGSDHCPVRGLLRCALLASPRCPPLCTRHMPEFMGRQQKLSRFLVKVGQAAAATAADSQLPGSQESGEVRENLPPAAETGRGSGTKRRPLAEPSASRNKKARTATSGPRQQGNLLAFFRPRPTGAGRGATAAGDGDPLGGRQDSPARVGGTPEESAAGSTTATRAPESSGVVPSVQPAGQDVSPRGNGLSLRRSPKENELSLPGSAQPDGPVPEEEEEEEEEGGRASQKPQHRDGEEPQRFWKSVLRGPPTPPSCKAHGEPCVLRTVKKPGPNLGRQFFVCNRPQGHASNPDARCNFFTWVAKGR